jgi:predicted RNA binding protein YcfA (HicA-like mRNA interferase family)
MATDVPRRDIIQRLKDAGFELVHTDGKHDEWRHPNDPWAPVPRHRMISAGVVRKINNAIREAEGKCCVNTRSRSNATAAGG